MVEQLEENATSFLQEQHASYSLTRQEGSACIGNVDAPIHFPNAIREFQALIEELKSQSVMIAQRLDERMAKQTKAMADQVNVMVEQTKAIVKQAQATMAEQTKAMAKQAKAMKEKETKTTIEKSKTVVESLKQQSESQV